MKLEIVGYILKCVMLFGVDGFVAGGDTVGEYCDGKSGGDEGDSAGEVYSGDHGRWT